MKSIKLCTLVLALFIGPNYGRFVSMDNQHPDEDSYFDRPTDHAKVARQVVHSADWTAFGTNSATKELRGFPMVNVISVADSKRGAPSTGNIYFYLTNLDYTAQDLMRDNRLTMLFSQDQNLSCSKDGVDPMEPTCARIMISGHSVVMENSTAEFTFARDAFIDRHPAATNWIQTHAFYLCKLDIASVIVLDWYGGPHNVTVDDYFNANIDDNENRHHKHKQHYLKHDDNAIDASPEPDHIRIRVNRKSKEIDIDL